MVSFEVQFKRSALKELRRFPKDIVQRIYRQVRQLANDPLPRGVVKLTDSENHFRLRVGGYRVIYEVERESQRVIINHIRHRSTAYR